MLQALLHSSNDRMSICLFDYMLFIVSLLVIYTYNNTLVFNDNISFWFIEEKKKQEQFALSPRRNSMFFPCFSYTDFSPISIQFMFGCVFLLIPKAILPKNSGIIYCFSAQSIVLSSSLAFRPYSRELSIAAVMKYGCSFD